MKIERTPLADVLIVEPDIFGDDRGYFLETYNRQRYEEAGIQATFVQDNLSKSMRGTLRGLHFQRPPFEQGKLISVVAGSVFDVAVDLRRSSSTYGRWFGLTLSGTDKKQLWIPPGFAHGFLALEDDTIFSYKCTNFYSPAHDGGILWNDSDIAITWPMNSDDLILSAKDQRQPRLRDLPEIPFV